MTFLRALAAAGTVLLAVVSLQGVTDPKVQYTDTKLKNGLRVIISEDHVAPVFAIAVSYNVGSRNERKGRTGFAHLFEHMMFKGSENVGPGEHFVLIFNNGGSMNGTTNKERTLYFEQLPANQLDLALFLEADRMRSLAITKENLDNQRNAVQEERRLGVDNQPYGRTFEALDELAYENFAYEHSVIGSMDDLNAATVDDVVEFFKAYYAPNNAVLALVGDVDTDVALAKARQYFESIPSQPPAPPVDLTEPPQREERRRTLDDPLARLPRVDVAYHIPGVTNRDHDALSVLATVLAGGRSSRMFENIIRQKQLALNATASAGQARGPALFRLAGVAAPGKLIAEVETALHEEVERIKTGTIEAWELEKARTMARRQFVGSLASSLQRAIQLTEYTLSFDDPGVINTSWARLASVTATDLQRVAKQYLTSENRTVVITNPKPAAPSAAAGQDNDASLTVRSLR